MEQIRSQIFPADVARLRRLGEMLTFIAGLPESGAHILTDGRRERVELHDLILQHRGTAVNASMRIHLCWDEKDERTAVAGVDPELIYLAPGYTAHWVIAKGGQPKTVKAAPVAAGAVSPLGALASLGLPLGQGPSNEVPGALRHANLSAAAEPIRQPTGWTYRLPRIPARQSTPGPWHKPEFKSRLRVEVVVRSWFDGGFLPYRLSAELPPGCGGGLHGVYATQAEADAALPGFVRNVREMLEGHATRNDTVPLAA